MKENPDSFCHLTKWYILAYIEYCKENKRYYRGACGNRLRAGWNPPGPVYLIWIMPT